MNVVKYFVKYEMNKYTTENLEYLLYVFTIEDVRRWGNPDRWRALMTKQGFGLAWEQASWLALGGIVYLDDDYNIGKHPEGDFQNRVKVYDRLFAAYNRQDR